MTTQEQTRAASEESRDAEVWRSRPPAGAAVSNVAPGNVALYSIVPNYLILSGDLFSSAIADAAETTATSQSWDFIVAQAICVAK